jgi:hypothetical protein
LGTTFVASSVGSSLVATSSLTESNSSDRDRSIVYELSGDFVNEVNNIYNFENLVALKSRYKEAGKLVTVTQTSSLNYRKVVMVFNSKASKDQYIGEYLSNISNYKKIIS